MAAKKPVSLVNKQSLAGTLDAVNDAFFHGRRLTAAQRGEAALWIAGRQGLPRSYAGAFAPTEQDFKTGIRLYTGEWMRSGAGTSHILGEEACRSLIWLDVKQAGVKRALSQASGSLWERISLNQPRAGVYCCGSCSVSFWRNLAAGGLDDQEKQLRGGINYLKNLRDGKGRWQVFPFYYTLLALTEIDLPPARTELRYAAAACERVLKRNPGDDQYAIRRQAVAQRALGAC